MLEEHTDSPARTVAVFGSTGSIGTQTLEVCSDIGARVTALSAHSNGKLLLEQSERFNVLFACLTDPVAASRFSPDFKEAGIKLFQGPAALEEMISELECEIVVNGLVSSAGLLPTLSVLKKGIDVALANKESLVAGGRLVMEAAADSGAMILPVDSEHSAVFQCLKGERLERVRRIILTASGGPFRSFKRDELRRVTVSMALAHPTWNMGPKVTIDSATLMNKGLEVLEAHHLFGVPLERIEVVVHPQSVIHSMVEMVDSSVLAQMGVPDMRVPIQYALTHPDRMPSQVEELSLLDAGRLDFEPVDARRFPCLALAYIAGGRGGTAPSVMNAANEEAVKAFLSSRIGFTDIALVIEEAMEKVPVREVDSVDDILAAESEARIIAGETIDRLEDRRAR